MSAETDVGGGTSVVGVTVWNTTLDESLAAGHCLVFVSFSLSSASEPCLEEAMAAALCGGRCVKVPNKVFLGVVEGGMSLELTRQWFPMTTV